MIEVEKVGAVQTIRMNRPEKKNALTDQMYVAFSQALEAGERDPEVAVHLILGSGGVFTAGNDIADFLTFAQGGKLGDGVIGFLRILPDIDKPLIAAVDGLAIGVGTTMLFHCDLVLASPRAVFKTPFLDLGLVPEAGSSLLAPCIMGQGRAFELLCAGRTFTADQAHAAGFVNEVIPDPDLEQQALALCADLSSKPPDAMRIARKMVRGSNVELKQRIEDEIDAFRDRLQSDEARAAFMAFMARK
ncbi:MAG: crotonase/enoyl-CoA hydratase family protein [Stappiaceae bacterium]